MDMATAQISDYINRLPHRAEGPGFEYLRTVLTVYYNWKYETERLDLKKLYEKAKREQWNATTEIDWNRKVNARGGIFPEMWIPIYGSDLWEAMSPERRLDMQAEEIAWMLSQFMHGEQGALLVTAQIVDAIEDYDAKLFGASQVYDEARHVEVFAKYLLEKIGTVYPIDATLKSILDAILTDNRWDMKYLGMQVLVEGLAMAAFGLMHAVTTDPLLKDLLYYVMKDEARHVAFGNLSLRKHYPTLSAEELEERKLFAYDACVKMRDRFLARPVWRKMGLDEEVCAHYALNSAGMIEFRKLLFSNIIPNLKKLGLLEGPIREKYAALGILQYEDLPGDEDL